MRHTGFVVLMLCLWAPALAARPFSVDEFRTMLQSHSTRDSDTSLAHRILNVELAQQLTPPIQASILNNLKLGPKSQQALAILADESAFADPPPNELPQREAPDDAAAKAILASAIRYAGSALQRMPNFLATRITTSFDTSPTTRVTADGFSPMGDLHHVSTSRTELAFRNGKEIRAAEATAPADSFLKSTSGKLASEGEFGPIFGVLLRDLPGGSIRWGHWEQLPTGLSAVFTFTVPQPSSHYRINYCCVPASRFDEHSISVTPAYHGRVFVDPATGTILRLVLEADFQRSYPIKRAALLVDYAPVQLGDQLFYTPSRSVALLNAITMVPDGDDLIRHLNRAAFTNYRRFGSEVRIVP